MRYIIFAIIVFSLNKAVSQPCINPVTSNCFDAITEGSQFLMSTPGNVDFVFDEMREYVTGITLSGKTMLRLDVREDIAGACKWKLIMYIDNNMHLPDFEWEPLVTYGTTGANPELGLIEVKVYNGCGTPLQSGVYQVFNNIQYDVIEIIPDGPRIIPAPCDGSQVNGPGSYVTDYNEFNFTIDYRIKPGYLLRSGAYQIKIHFCLVEV